MIAYTGIETVSNLAEEARDPTRTIPASIRLVAVAVFAIYFTLPLVALSALPVYKDAAGDYVTKLGLPPDKGGFENDPVLGLVENLGLHGSVLSAREDLRRRPRRDDPLHRHERRRDRRLADHVLDGELPAAAGGLPAPAPALQDAVALAGRLRRRDLDRGAAPGQGRLPRDDVLVRRDALVHDRARVDHRAAAQAAPRPGRSAPARTCGSAGSTCRSSPSSAGSGPRSPGSSSSSSTRRRAGRGSAGSRSGSSSTGSTAAGSSTAALRETVRAPALVLGPSLTVEYRTIVVPVEAHRRERGGARRRRAARGRARRDRRDRHT